MPAALFRDREFVVDAKIDPDAADSIVQVQVLDTAPKSDAAVNFKAPLVGKPNSPAAKRLIQGFDDFRRCFPLYIAHSQVIPNDEVVCLKLYHREDEPLIRLFLDREQTRRLDRLWEELRFISRYPVTEHDQLPQFIGFVTQDNPKQLVDFFESQREPFRKRAEAFEKDVEACIPRQLATLVEFAGRAYRRPLAEKEKTDLVRLYRSLRQKKMPHEEAFRTVLTRVLVAPSFLFRLEQTAAGPDAQPCPAGSWRPGSATSCGPPCRTNSFVRQPGTAACKRRLDCRPSSSAC